MYLFVYLSYQPYTSLHFAIPNYNSLPFTFHFLSPLLPLTGLHFPNPRFENMPRFENIWWLVVANLGLSRLKLQNVV